MAIVSRRRFLELVGAAGGSTAVYRTASALGLMAAPGAMPLADLQPLQGAKRKVLILGAGIGGLTAANASMGAISLFKERAGAASAVYGFTHALLAAGVGAIAGALYHGRLIEPALIILICAIIAIGGFVLARVTAEQDTVSQ